MLFFFVCLAFICIHRAQPTLENNIPLCLYGWVEAKSNASYLPLVQVTQAWTTNIFYPSDQSNERQIQKEPMKDLPWTHSEQWGEKLRIAQQAWGKWGCFLSTLRARLRMKALQGKEKERDSYLTFLFEDLDLQISWKFIVY